MLVGIGLTSSVENLPVMILDDFSMRAGAQHMPSCYNQETVILPLCPQDETHAFQVPNMLAGAA